MTRVSFFRTLIIGDKVTQILKREKMISDKFSRVSEKPKPNWIYYLLLLLIAEKIVQHIVVTLAFYFNWSDIVSTVVVSPIFLMISGAFVAILFIVSFWGLITKQKWSVGLVIALALFDIIGEFVAQGRPDIVITVSFLVAVFLLFLSLMFRHQPLRVEH